MDMFINDVEKGSEKGMTNVTCGNKSLRAVNPRNSYEGLLALQKDFMLLVGWRIQYLVKSSAAKHETMHLEKKTGTVMDSALVI